MDQKKKGVVLGGLLLAFFTLYIFRQNVYFSLLDNYVYFSGRMIAWMPKAITIVLIILAAKFISLIVDSILRKYFKYVGRIREYYSVTSVSKYFIWMLAVIGILSVMIGNLGVWLTSVGLIGFGITFALQKPILNFVGWVTIVITKAYSLGDRIKVGEDRGDVIEIQIMYTVIDGLLDDSDELSGKIITIPNESVLTSSITNYTKSGEYLWDGLMVDITYESNWKKAVDILKEITYIVVNKYVRSAKNEVSEKQEQMTETMDMLKKQHRTADSNKEKKILETEMDSLEDEQMKFEGIKEFAFHDIKKEPMIRVTLKESSIGLSVRYVAHYSHIRMMRSEISTDFLDKVARTKDVEVAYPHLQIVGQSKFFGNKKRK